MLLSNMELLATAPGGVAKLRELILTLAVQGKLVPQDPADEPAAVLLQKIRAEKDRLVAEGTIKRDKPLAEIGEEEKPFGLPQGWEWVRLGAVINASEAGWSPTCIGSPRRPGHWGVLKVSAVSWGRFDPTANKELPLELTPKREYEVKDGDFLLSRANTAELVARSVVVGVAEPQLMLSDKIIRLAVSSQMNRAFLNIVNNANYSREHYAANASGTSSSMKNVSREVVLALPVPLPPLAEQSRIVTRVEALMRLCDALEAKGQLEATQHAQLVSTLLGTLTASTTPEELAAHWQRVAQHFDLLLDRPEAIDALEQTLLQLAVRGLLLPQDPTDEPASALLQKIRTEKDRLIATGQIKQGKPLPPITDEEKPFELPVGWEWVRFGQVVNIASNLVQPNLHGQKWQVAPDCIEKGTGRLLHKRTVAQAEIISPNHLFKPGQILYSKIRPSLSKAVLVDFEGLCSADMYPIESPLNSQYLLMYILSQPFLDQVSAAENRVKMPKLNQEALLAFTIALPPLPEQSRIVTRVTALRRLCADLRQRLAERQSVQARLAEALVQQQAFA